MSLYSVYFLLGVAVGILSMLLVIEFAGDLNAK